MPPIRVHTSSPINAANAAGITPQTEAAANKSNHEQNQPTTTTSNSNTTPPPTRTTPFLQNPPPPQPGAVPRLPQPTGTTSLPPAPRAGAGAGAGASGAGPASAPAPTPAPALPPSLLLPGGAAYPPRMAAIPPPLDAPTAAYNVHQRGTMAAAGDAGVGAGGYGGYVPGYPQQQQYQQGGAWGGGNRSAVYVPPQAYQAATGRAKEEEGEEGMLGSAMKLARAAGERLSAAEREVWRRINGEGR